MDSDNNDGQNKDNRRRRSISGLFSPPGLYTIPEDIEMEDSFLEHVEEEDSLSIDLTTVTMSSDTSSEEYDYKPPLYTRTMEPQEQCGKGLHQRAQSWHGNTLVPDYGLTREEEEAFCRMIKDLDKDDGGDKTYKDLFGMEAGPSHAFGRFGATSVMPKGSVIPKGGEGLFDEPEQEGANSSGAARGKKKEDGSGEAPN